MNALETCEATVEQTKILTRGASLIRYLHIVAEPLFVRKFGFFLGHGRIFGSPLAKLSL